jgi:hypothetical protein
MHFKSQVHWRIIASAAAYPKQQKAILVSIDVQGLSSKFLNIEFMVSLVNPSMRVESKIQDL